MANASENSTLVGHGRMADTNERADEQNPLLEANPGRQQVFKSSPK
ncbi:hypothetical protein NC651_004580 [Populus alba x Populus x berolinensis]|nr:hypothetical protein NC651_004580 [Populus alba x Populus x berolinensis]